MDIETMTLDEIVDHIRQRTCVESFVFTASVGRENGCERIYELMCRWDGGWTSARGLLEYAIMRIKEELNDAMRHRRENEP